MISVVLQDSKSKLLVFNTNIILILNIFLKTVPKKHLRLLNTLFLSLFNLGRHWISYPKSKSSDSWVSPSRL